MRWSAPATRSPIPTARSTRAWRAPPGAPATPRRLAPPGVLEPADPLGAARVGVYPCDRRARFRVKVSPTVRRLQASPRYGPLVRRIRVP